MDSEFLTQITMRLTRLSHPNRHSRLEHATSILWGLEESNISRYPKQSNVSPNHHRMYLRHQFAEQIATTFTLRSEKQNMAT